MYLLIKYTKSVLWRVAKRLSYIEDARCLKVSVPQQHWLFGVSNASKRSSVWPMDWIFVYGVAQKSLECRDVAQVASRLLFHLFGGSGSMSGKAMWDLWCRNWHWDRFIHRALRSSPVTIIPPLLHSHLHVHVTLTRKKNV